ncbi:hypothetical protein [Halomonas sp. ATBC28]|uniref:hypothetical protein n=1 Tax=Halomonas sp. ATBC28 TaxID=2545264 RepID=UPI0014875724|nr:hypothetical protein [Halomonas sp. ATBC28]
MIVVARGNEEREFSERFEAPAGGGGTTPSGTEPSSPTRANPGTASRCFRGCASLTTRY